jgi:hypothetical protein
MFEKAAYIAYYTKSFLPLTAASSANAVHNAVILALCGRALFGKYQAYVIATMMLPADSSPFMSTSRHSLCILCLAYSLVISSAISITASLLSRPFFKK